MNVIPLAECKQGVVYELTSRNLIAGVFVKERAGFIGIREKFGSKFLFMEYHYDTGAPFGTAHPLKELTKAPDGIPLAEDLDTVDETTKRPVKFDRPVAEGGKGWYFPYTGEASEGIRAVSIPNRDLFAFLEGLEKGLIVECPKCEREYTPSWLNEKGVCSRCEARSGAPTGPRPRRLG